jgi:hypothetical protein
VAELARSFGSEPIVGGVTWERRVVDPVAGPRRLDEITGIDRRNTSVAIAAPDAAGPGGFRFAEGRMGRVPRR